MKRFPQDIFNKTLKLYSNALNDAYNTQLNEVVEKNSGTVDMFVNESEVISAYNSISDCVDFIRTCISKIIIRHYVMAHPDHGKFTANKNIVSDIAIFMCKFSRVFNVDFAPSDMTPDEKGAYISINVTDDDCPGVFNVGYLLFDEEFLKIPISRFVE